ncbi:hypothetical protein EDD80_10218 [Anseongella ginsenosidimutans]|uniref:Uncharacterized protein n=1 Tax=Anseongella ginsenosidimutans TaxID=496056 RepID=A0A4R3KUN0_9SPHI|nr:hypothetical protein [Anseongella ginsenosidimutans]QEC51516.1 hypothetical protein FRZ59_03530 [Anseongella ginsenosidimutans]TCS88828.1 hypothetical protein EDD80_10218 [Anseongella ginsenosidimutans]
MKESSNSTIIFYPTKKPTISSIWLGLFKMNLLILIISLAAYFIGHNISYQKYILVIALILSLWITLRTKDVYEISICKVSKELIFKYLTAFGHKGKNTIDLQTAIYSYRLKPVSKVSVRWHMHLYNNYFKNRLDLSGNWPYSKDQLDTIDNLITSLRRSETCRKNETE